MAGGNHLADREKHAVLSWGIHIKEKYLRITRILSSMPGWFFCGRGYEDFDDDLLGKISGGYHPLFGLEIKIGFCLVLSGFLFFF